jgi:hypothetical protein
MHHKIRPELEWLLNIGCGERVVHHNETVAGVAYFGHALDVHDVEKRIGGSLHPNQPRAGQGRQRLRVRLRRRIGGVGNLQPPGPKHLFQKAIGASVNIMASYNAISRVQRLEDRRAGRQT